MEAIVPQSDIMEKERLEAPVVRKRRVSRKQKRVKSARWSSLGTEVWSKIIRHLDGMALYAMMFVSRRYQNMVEDEAEAWHRAGLACLPHTWSALAPPGLKYSVTDYEVRLFLKYALLYERFSAQALISPSFSPYCLKSTGVSVSALSKALPSAHKFFQHASAVTAASIPLASNEVGPRQANRSVFQVSGHTSTPNPSATSPQSSQMIEAIFEHPMNEEMGSERSIEEAERPNEEPQGGEDLPFTDPEIAISDAPRSLSKSHGSLQRSLSKLKKVIGFIHKPSKATPSPTTNDDGIPSLSSLRLTYTNAKKRHIHFEEPSPLENASSGVDEAWFRLPDPKNLEVPGLTLGRWRVMSEVNLLVNTMSVFRLNPKVVTVGAYMVRRLCYLESPAFVGEEGSIRNRLANTPIVEILLDALETFKKDVTVVASILVALGNLALAAISACVIGDRGLGLIFRIMKRHRSIPKIIEYSIFLLLNVCDTRIEYKKKLRDLEVPQFIVKELAKFIQSIRMSDKAHRKASVDSKTTSSSASESLAASLKVVMASYGTSGRQRSHSETLSSQNILSTETYSLVDSQGGAAGGSERSVHSDSSASVPDLEDSSILDEESEEIMAVEEDGEEEVEEDGAEGLNEMVDERACAWMLKHRPSLAVLHLELIQHRPSDLRMISRLLDMLCVLSADYDILKTDLALKSATLIGELIVMLFGSPWSSVDAVVTSAFRCLLVIYEWDVHHQDWASCERLVHCLIILARTFVKSIVRLPYAVNCYLVIFSLVWKRWEQHTERKELVNLIIASLRLELFASSSSNHVPSSSPGMSTTSSSLGSHSSSSSSSISTTAATSPPSLLIPGAAMLGDLAHSFYSLRTFIRDAGAIQLLRTFRETLDGDILTRLNDILDEFEDNPLLRGRHRRQQDDQQNDAAPAGDDPM